MLKDSNLNFQQIKKINAFETEYIIKGLEKPGKMVCIDVYPGIQVIYNQFHSLKSPHGQTLKKEHIEINHCLRGKFEGLFHKDCYAYLDEGDLSISKWTVPIKSHSFPLGYYEGVEVLIDIELARTNPVLKVFHLSIDALSQKLTSNDDIFVLRSTKQIQHICLEFYEIDPEMKLDYLKIKILELLLFLSHTDFHMIQDHKKYLPKKQVETIKIIKNYLTNHLSEKPDFQKLADEHQINIHTLRKSFKEIYGKPIYQWFKEFRMEQSLHLLKNPDIPIIDIANQMGYSNPSKFSAAFYQYMKMTPLQYRKSNLTMD